MTRRSGNSDGRLAWIASEGRTTGNFHGKAIDRITTETMLLRRDGGAWKIAHIHWSSAAAPAPARGAATSNPLLAGSVPANGAVVAGPVAGLQLSFSPPARLLEITIGGPDGQMPMMVTAAGEQSRYSLPLPGLGKGNYSVDWRAIAAGREDRGTFSFTVK
jgi:methionine-rich copper-binding protein CopC